MERSPSLPRHAIMLYKYAETQTEKKKYIIINSVSYRVKQEFR